eukprot:236712-Alexandrium_andersonii.AAC.1
MPWKRQDWPATQVERAKFGREPQAKNVRNMPGRCKPAEPPEALAGRFNALVKKEPVEGRDKPMDVEAEAKPEANHSSEANTRKVDKYDQ